MTAAQVRAHTDRMTPVPDPEVPQRARPPRTYPAAYKLRILGEYEQLDKAGKGALLRREGLYTSLISEWRKQRDKGALAALGTGTRRGRPPVDPLVRDNARLAAENARLRDQLARQAKVIEVRGELSALLGRLATGSVDPAEPGPGEPPTSPTPPARR
jgi:transposase